MDPRETLVNRALNPLLRDLPLWVSAFRPQQIDAVMQVLDAFDSGKQVVVLDAPTGTGKTLIAETVRKMMRAEAVYVCSSKGLQDQFVNDYPYASVIKGRSNYPTELRAREFSDDWTSVSCADCQWSKSHPACDLCVGKSSCPYERAKDAAIRSSLAVSNYSYALAEWNHVGRLANRDLCVLDEADVLESSIMGFVTATVSSKRMQKYGWTAPKVTVRADWERWIDDTLPDIEVARRRLHPYSSIRDNKEDKALTNLANALEHLRGDTNGWVFTGREGSAEWKPVRVHENALVYGHAQRFLLMSATVISSTSLLTATGWQGPFASISLDSTFPVRNRPVIIRGVANMSHKNDGKGLDALGKAIVEVLDRTPRDDRILIHSVSYALARELGSRLTFTDRKVIVQTSGTDRESSLSQYLSTSGSVLVSPSLGRGVDLPNDACRVQIIAKIPFPNLGDRQISARAYSGSEGKTWYTVETVRTIVQMCGRAVRSVDDHAKTYILDSQFESVLWSKARHLFPKWWREALVWERA